MTKEIPHDQRSEKIWLGIMLLFLNDHNQVLMGKRKNAFAAGEFGIPSGHMEVGETVQAAAMREVREELGVSVDQQDLYIIAISNYLIPEWNRQYVTFDFLVRKWSGAIQTAEKHKCEEWVWFDLEKLPKNIHYPAQRTIEHYFEWLKTKTVLLD